MQILIALLCCFLFLSSCGRSPQPTDVIELPAKKEMKKKAVKEEKSVTLKKKKTVKQHAAKKKAADTETKKVPPITIAAARQKKTFEFVSISGSLYPVPTPWRGQKITQKSPPLSQLKQIPVEFTWNESKIYIRQDTCDAFVKMATEAKEKDIHLLVHSGFRSERYQKQIFSNLIAQGRTWDDLVRYVAPPGYSEHMLGIVVDLYPSNWRFAETAEYKWLKENAEFFGFTESYPKITQNNFPWEAWHWRFNDVSQRSDKINSP